MEAKELIRQLVRDKLRSTDCFLVDIKVSQNDEAKVFIDSDKGVTIDKCAEVNRFLRNRLEEEGLDFGLQVSSPGLGEPLKIPRQYKKNVGQRVEVRLKNGIRRKGTLLTVNEDQIVVEEKKRKKKGKKKTKEIKKKEYPISFDDIKSTRIILKF